MNKSLKTLSLSELHINFTSMFIKMNISGTETNEFGSTPFEPYLRDASLPIISLWTPYMAQSGCTASCNNIAVIHTRSEWSHIYDSPDTHQQRLPVTSTASQLRLLEGHTPT